MTSAFFGKAGFGTIGVLFLTALFQGAQAAPPDLKTPSPVIYLANNLDEKDRLGWCIDTLGRGWSDRLQAHSCKPRGGDVQFSYDTKSRQLRSVAFPGKCAEIIDPDSKTVAFGLLDCSADSTKQKFDFESAQGFFKPVGHANRCLAVGAASRSAGPYMSRDLILADCAATDARFMKWIIK